jgi:putative transposase
MEDVFTLGVAKNYRYVVRMARRARIILPGVPHHVTQRGNRRQKVFFTASDYQVYLELLQTSAKAFEFEIWSYCLMPNHVHLMVVPKTESSLRDGISHLHQCYTRAINRSHKWQGHLWQGRFFSCPVQHERAAIVARYIELNPVRAAIVSDPKDYIWSSAAMACNNGHGGKSGFAPLYAPGGTWEEYLKYDPNLDSKDSLNEIRLRANRGVPYASDTYIKDLERSTGLSVLPKPKGRPGQMIAQVPFDFQS